MAKIRFLFAMLVAKCVRLALRALGRNGSFLPGDIALKIDPAFLGHVKKPDTLIAVTGTNGKTTTSNLINSILKKNGIAVMNNSLGSNVQSGIAGCFVENCSLSGRPKYKIAVLEVDERSSLRVYKYIAPDILVVNNIMRDSIKRNANTDFISFIINSATPASARVFLNGDDCICANLLPQCKDRVYFGVDALAPDSAEEPFISDIKYCPVCGKALVWKYRRWNHIGRVSCPGCGFGTPERDYVVTKFDAEAGVFAVRHGEKENEYKLISDNIVNVYNSCAAIAVLTELGLTDEQIARGFSESEVVKTRLETEKIGDTEIVCLLAKGQNPCAVARCFSYVADAPGERKAMVAVIDDHDDNIRNSENTAWFFDLDYSPLADSSVKALVFAGERCLDHELRCAMTGIDEGKVLSTPDWKKAAGLINPADYDRIFLLFDNYRLTEKAYVQTELENALRRTDK